MFRDQTELIGARRDWALLGPSRPAHFRQPAESRSRILRECLGGSSLTLVTPKGEGRGVFVCGSTGKSCSSIKEPL